MVIKATHEININIPQLANAIRRLIKEKYPLFNEKDDKNMLLIIEQVQQNYRCMEDIHRCDEK